MNAVIKTPRARGSKLWTAESASVMIPVSAGTLAGFRAWVTSDDAPRNGRFSYLGTELYVEMSPERIASHNVVKTEFARVFATLLKQTDQGKFFGDGTLLTNEQANLSTEPDGLVVTWKTFTSGLVRLVPTADNDDAAELAGTPDIVLEVISPSSLTKDAVRLRQQYHQAGIPEYWLVDARGEEIDFQILHREPADYATVPASRSGWLPSAVLGRRFRLTRELDRIGLWEYTLHARR
jgi:Uma2 family endonuclease